MKSYIELITKSVIIMFNFGYTLEQIRTTLNIREDVVVSILEEATK
jgi:hypothetical protein